MKVLAIVGAALAATGVAIWVRWLLRRQADWNTRLAKNIPVHSDWWKGIRATEGELLYVAIGDSTAQGIGASKPGRSYVGFVAKHLRDRTGRTVRIVNLGISGATVGIAIAKELPALKKLGLEADLLTVSIGANDIADFHPARFEDELRELLAALPTTAIVADVPTFYFLPGEKKVRVANEILRRLAAERGMTVVDLHQRMSRQPWGPMTQFAGDLFHPNDRGYKLWATAFTPELDRRFPESVT